jgi:hypothetical protein
LIYGNGGTIRSEAEELKAGVGRVKLWLKKIDKQKSDAKYKRWHNAAKTALAAYDGELIDELPVAGANMFYANIDTAAPAIYNSPPVPDLRVRYDEDNQAAEDCCDILERAVLYDMDQRSLDDVMVDIVLKGLVVGEGYARVRYEADFEKDEATGVDAVKMDRVYAECVTWDRIICGPARTWDKLRWIAFEHEMPIAEVERMNKAMADNLVSSKNPTYTRDRHEGKPSEEPNGILETINAYEVWDRDTGLVLWITPQDDTQAIKVIKDPLKLRNFFPVIKPHRPRGSIDALFPHVHYDKHKGLYEEYERTNRRINNLIKQAKVKGLYDAKLAPDFAKLEDCADGVYIPADASEQFLAGGGKGDLSNAIAHWPNEQIVATINSLAAHREVVKNDIWEATGLSDIMRGSTKPSETLGAQNLKQENGALRLRNVQKDAARAACDIIRLMIEVRANLTPWTVLKEITAMKFAPTDAHMQAAQQQVMASMSQPQAQPDQQGQPLQQAPQPDPQQQQMMEQQAQQIAMQMAKQAEAEVEKLVKSPHRLISIDIETDSTIRADVSRDLDQCNQLIGMTGQFATAIGTMGQIVPATVEPMFKVFASQVRKFRLGRAGEEALDELIEQAKKPPVSNGPSEEQQAQEQAAQQQQQAAEQAKQKQAAAEAEKAAQRAAMIAEREQAVAERQAERDERMAEIAQMKEEAKAEADRAKHEMQMQRDADKAEREREREAEKAMREREKHDMQMQMSRMKAMHDAMKAETANQNAKDKAKRDKAA